MYNSLKIKNLKTFKTDQTLKIAPITLIYGENSSGKTAILKSFDIAHNIFAEHRIRNQKTVDDKSNVFFSRIIEELDILRHISNVFKPRSYISVNIFVITQNMSFAWFI